MSQMIKFPKGKLIRLMIVDEHELFGECLALALSGQEDLLLIERLSDSTPALEKVGAQMPDVVLISLNLKNDRALELTKQISTHMNEVKVILLGLAETEREVLECIEAGASGYVLQYESLDRLWLTISSVHRGEAVCSPQIAFRAFGRVAELKRLRQDGFTVEGETLTCREIEILQLIVDGLSNKQMADRLCVSLHTVKNHVHNILNKLKVYRRSEAAYYGMNKGLQRR